MICYNICSITIHICSFKYLRVILNLFIQIAIVRLTTHNHQEEQDLDEAEVMLKVNITCILSTVYTAANLPAKMYCFEKVI